MMPHRFGRPSNHGQPLSSFIDEASRLRAFAPPFRFTSFFSPEDTLLCVCASEAALSHARKPGNPVRPTGEPVRITELTAGSGLVGLHLLRIERNSNLLAFDVDPIAIATARSNAATLGLSGRSRFECVDLWSDATTETLARFGPHLMVCNPPYVPEPKEQLLDLVAGAGEDGTAHLMRTIDLARSIKPRAMALSWCSLSDPGKVVQQAESAGYILDSLFIVAIADGEYSGSVHEYLKTLRHAYINESDEVRTAVAPDGSARFGYLLMAGDFYLAPKMTSRRSGNAEAVERICSEFSSKGIQALVNPAAPVPVRTWILDRWDEVRLRASLHGEIPNTVTVRT